MVKTGKKHKKALEQVGGRQSFSVAEGIDMVLKTKHAGFDESVDAAVALGIDASKGEQTVRGSVLLPHGTGKNVRVLVFAKGDYEDAAKKSGADFVGTDDLIEKIEKGWTDFDAAVATPDLMGIVSRVARVLGPRGLLPNKKTGTITFDVGAIVNDLKKGRVSYRNDKGGVVHAPFGKVSFGVDKLKENLVALVRSVQASKPPTSRGKFFKKITISSTMGVGVSIPSEEVL